MSLFVDELCLKETEQWVEMSLIEGDNYSLASIYLPKLSCK